jgi:FlaA1/EpsC-like NDP-sugar epimerase
MNRLSRPTKEKFLLDLAAWSFVGVLAFFVRIDLPLLEHKRVIAFYVLLGLLPKAGLLYYFGLHRQSWHKVGVRDLYRLAAVVALWTVPVYLINFVLYPSTFVPRSIPLVEGFLAVIALGGVRLLARVLFEKQSLQTATLDSGRLKRVLIVGAGEAGTFIAREMIRHPASGLQPIGFLDDERAKQGQSFVGLPLLGVVDALPRVALETGADEVLIAIPSASGKIVRRVVDLAREASIPYRIIPGVFEILSGKVGISQIRPVSLEDLLRRDSVKLETAEIAGYLEARTVLVTGAGGSIGSEIVRQVARFVPTRVILLGRGENSVYLIQQELRRTYPELETHAVIADVRDFITLRRAFERFKPEVVFHAAAHKHVPLMEENPWEAVFNNIQGTSNIVDLCLEFAVQRLVNVSTDKAVNPTSVMGASKRVAEFLVQRGAAKAKPEQDFVSVRFGNVLGSRGSVIPLFQEQIKAGGPVTITHPDMTRYFMTIPEASQLVLQAGGLADNGAVYVLDMGEPVKIVDLARDVIRLSGFEVGRDIEIVYSGVRPGEKLFEELLTAEEGTSASKHTKIFVARESAPPENLEAQLLLLKEAAARGDAGAVRAEFKRLIPTFRDFIAI